MVFEVLTCFHLFLFKDLDENEFLELCEPEIPVACDLLGVDGLTFDILGRIGNGVVLLWGIGVNLRKHYVDHVRR